MDRDIPKKEQIKKKRIKAIKYSSIVLIVFAALIYFIYYFQTGVGKKDIILSTVDRGTLEVSTSASGKIVPAFQEVINSPINSRILEVYKKGGDWVDKGTPLLKLDLQSAETDYKKQLDEKKTKIYEIEQLKVNNRTKLSDMLMQIKVSQMKLNRMLVEMRNEHYLDSIGAGTTDKVREAQLNYKVAKLELDQLKTAYENEKQNAVADLNVKELDLSIFKKTISETVRLLADARIKSPRKAVLSFINNQIGAQVAQGTQIATVSDLSHYKVECEIADSYGDKVFAGGKAVVKIGNEEMEGTISSVTPVSQNGVISFIVQLKEDQKNFLRSGLKADVYIVNSVKDNVMRIANGSFYNGAGNYDLFVREKNKLIKKRVVLGDSNYDYVEVVSGLKPGDTVVVSDMSNYKDKNRLKLN